jgi:NADH-quinone oxidoreductase subunit M
MDFILDHLLTLIVFTPLAAAVIISLLPSGRPRLIKWSALGLSLIPLALSLILWFNFEMGGGFQFEEQYEWFPQIGSSYHLGADGISTAMILLTGILTPLAVIISFSINDRVKAYFALFMMLQMGMFGVFVSLDLIIFFIFWEFGLVPMYFLINQWGSKNRVYASQKFFLYTMAGSIGMLLAIQMMWFATGGVNGGSFDIPLLYERWQALSNDGVLFFVSIGTIKNIAFWAFTIAFLIKVPAWPFHTWLPDAHTEAPTAGSMILAGVLLKLGAFGLLRLVLPLFPSQAADFAPVLAVLALLAIVLGAFASYAQNDFKRLVAYSSVGHMGFVVLGIAVAAATAGTAAYGEHGVIAYSGAVLQMFNHGLSSAAMFALVGVVYERTHTRDLKEFGGLWAVMPAYGGILIFSAMASLGLPGLNGFWSEFMVVRGSWPQYTLITALAMLGLLMTGAYVLKAIVLTLQDKLNPRWEGIKDISWREAWALIPLMVLMLATGIWPRWILDVINAAANLMG